jgi:hypothetical protein
MAQDQQPQTVTTGDWQFQCRSHLDQNTIQSLMQNPQLQEVIGDALTEAVKKFAQQKGHPDNGLELNIQSGPKNLKHHAGNGDQSQYGQGASESTQQRRA